MRNRRFLKLEVFIFLIVPLTFSCNSSHELNHPANNPEYVLFPSDLGVIQEPDSNRATIQGIELGRHLFYDKRISRNDSVSCSSCHMQRFAFADNKKHSIGISNSKSKFNSPTLSNLAYSSHFFWDGRDQSLEVQALSPIINIKEMDQRLRVLVDKLNSIDQYPAMFTKAFGTNEITPKRVSFALAQFQRSLISNNSKYDKYLLGRLNLSKDEMLGMQLFFTIPDIAKGTRGGACFKCHETILFSGRQKGFSGFANNGLDNTMKQSWGLFGTTEIEEDKGKFIIPTLRNIEVTGPYMHDGRFATLEDVLAHYSSGVKSSPTLHPVLSNYTISSIHGSGFRFTTQEEKALISFLKTLTDGEFLNDENLSSPF